MQENPVFNREVRARWRRPAMVVWFGLYSLLVAWATHTTYGNAAYYQRQSGQYLQDWFASLGQDLFFSIAMLQIYLASIFAAVVTPPTIVTERESGTLQILRTAPLTVRQLVYGKYFGALLIVLLLICVPLPAISIAFVMGGVSAPDLLAVSIIEFTSGAVCGAIGMYCSTCSKTTFQSMVRAVILSFVTLWVPSVLVSGLGDMGFLVWLTIGLTLAVSLAAFCLERSVARLRDEKHEGPTRRNRANYMGQVTSPPPPLGEVGFQGSGRQSQRYAPSSAPVPRGDEWSETFRTPGNATLTPVGRWLAFSNPVLQRQLRHNFRFFARGTQRDWRERRSLLWCGGGVWSGWMGLTFYFAKPSGHGAGLGWLGLIGFLAVTGATVDAATAFSRERTSNMLSSLLLTPLSPRAVACAKRDASLATGLFYLVLGAPLYAGAFMEAHANAPSAFLIWVALLVAGSTLGIMSGGVCRNAGVAVVAACTCLLIGSLVVMSYVSDMSGLIQSGGPDSVHPFWKPFALWLWATGGPEYAYFGILSGFTATLAAASLAILPVLQGMRPQALERETWTKAGKIFSSVK